MRAAAIFGLGTSSQNLDAFREYSATEWIEGVPARSADADAILVFGGDGTIHRHLSALVRLKLPVLVIPAGSGNDFARALKSHSIRDSLRVWHDFECGKARVQTIDLGVIRPSANPETFHYFCCVAGCGIDSIAAQRANRMPRWLRRNGGYVLSLLPLLLRLPAYNMRFSYSNHNGPERDDNLTLLAAFANTQFYGDGMRNAPDADPCDGKLDVCQILTMSPWRLFVCSRPFSRESPANAEVKYSKAERIRLETETPLEIYADGEFSATPASWDRKRSPYGDHGCFCFLTPDSSSNARFSSNTFTRGSPKNPHVRPAVWSLTNRTISVSVILLSIATR